MGGDLVVPDIAGLVDNLMLSTAYRIAWQDDETGKIANTRRLVEQRLIFFTG
jgi:hypothetical protein